jgi:hypothetical protein
MLRVRARPAEGGQENRRFALGAEPFHLVEIGAQLQPAD